MAGTAVEYGPSSLTAGGLDVAERLLQVSFFGTEVERAAFLRDPRPLGENSITEREVIVYAALQLVKNHRASYVSGETELQDDPFMDEQIKRAAAPNGDSVRLMARQLIVAKNVEDFVDTRLVPPHMQEAGSGRTDMLMRLCTFLRMHQGPDQPNAAAYDLLRKEAVVRSNRIDHQDAHMATLLGAIGIGQPASDVYLLPLRAAILTSNERATYRLAFSAAGNRVFRGIAPDLNLMTTGRYRMLVKPTDRLVVTSPGFMREALVSGRMVGERFDIVLTDRLTEAEQDATSTMLHAQRVCPVVIHFTVSPADVALGSHELVETE